MDYTVEVLRKAKSYGFRIFMDPHQDLFSRFTGGSGAPYWVLPACGINHHNITATQSAFLQFEYPTPEQPDPQSFPAMIWATNYTRLAAATLAVYFFAGRDLAPKCVIDGKNIQDWLQGHFIEACRQLAIRIRDAGDLEDECVIGWDSMNEPNPGYIGIGAITEIPEKWLLKKGPTPTPLQSMRLGAGQKQMVQNWTFGSLGPKRQKDGEIDPKEKSLWLTKEDDDKRGGSKWGWERSESWPLGVCPWAAHGAWDPETGEAKIPEYFKYFRGGETLKDGEQPNAPRPIEFVEDYWLPFWRSFNSAIRGVHREAIMFIQPPVFEPPPASLTQEDLQSRVCTSQHFYDGLTLITKHWNWFNADAVGLLRGKYPGVLFALKVGLRAIRQGMRDQLGYLRTDTLAVLGKYPTLIGEIGIPFDMDDRKTYYGDSKGNGIGDYREQATALDASLNACDGPNMLSFTAWAYNPDASHKYGDRWNGEDFSFWTKDDVKYANVTSDQKEKSSPLELSPYLCDASIQGQGPNASTPRITISEEQAVSANSPTLLSPAESSGAATPAAGSSAASSVMLGTVAHESHSSHVPAITNGSRCAQAFCRPYPMATTGSPVELNFDIKSSELTYVVEVEADDLKPDADGNILATEIFMPFMHYAADSVAGAASGNVSDAGRYSPHRRGPRSRAESLRKEQAGNGQANLSLSLDSLTTISGSNNGLQRVDSTQSGLAPYRSPDNGAASSSLSLNSATSVASTKDKMRLTSSGNNSSSADVPEQREKYTLALDVNVTAGSWEIEPGQQLLKWYLGKPGKNVPAAQPGRHRITLKRSGGPITFKQSASAFELLVEQGMSWL